MTLNWLLFEWDFIFSDRIPKNIALLNSLLLKIQ